MRQGLARYLVCRSRHRFVIVLFPVEPDDLGGEACLSGGAARAAIRGNHAPFIKGGRVYLGHFE